MTRTFVSGNTRVVDIVILDSLKIHNPRSKPTKSYYKPDTNCGSRTVNRFWVEVETCSTFLVPIQSRSSFLGALTGPYIKIIHESKIFSTRKQVRT